MKWIMFVAMSLGVASTAIGGTKIENINKVTAYLTDDAAKGLVDAFVFHGNEGHDLSVNIRDKDFGFWLNAELENFGDRLVHTGHIEVSRLHYQVKEDESSIQFNLKLGESTQLFKMLRGLDVQVSTNGTTSLRVIKTEAYSIKCSLTPGAYIPYECSIEIYK